MCAVARGDTGRGAPVWQREPAPPPRCPLPSFLPRARAGRARSRSALSGTGADRGGQRDRLQVGRPGAPGECLSPARFGSAHSPSRFFFFPSLPTDKPPQGCWWSPRLGSGGEAGTYRSYFSHRRVRQIFI